MHKTLPSTSVKLITVQWGRFSQRTHDAMSFWRTNAEPGCRETTKQSSKKMENGFKRCRCRCRCSDKCGGIFWIFRLHWRMPKVTQIQKICVCIVALCMMMFTLTVRPESVYVSSYHVVRIICVRFEMQFFLSRSSANHHFSYVYRICKLRSK